MARVIKLDDMKALWLKGGDANAAAYWEGSIAGPLIESTFQCVKNFSTSAQCFFE